MTDGLGAPAPPASGASPLLAAGSVRDRLLLAGVQLALLWPFLDKAIHLDDAFFLAIARHLQSAPLEPYGFEYNWAGTPASVWHEMKNPPAVFYCLALLLDLGATGERSLHAAFALFPLCATQVTYALARRVTREPLFPALLLALCPAFWVSATSLMIDVPLVAAMLLSLWLVVRAQETGRVRFSIASGLGAAFATLAKYFGLAVVPLLGVQLALGSVRGRGGLRAWAIAPIALPLLAFAGWWAASDGHVLQAVGYRAAERADAGTWIASHAVAAATFTAGLLGFPVAMLGAALLDERERGVAWLALAGGIAAGLLASWLWPGLPLLSAGLVMALAAASGVLGAGLLGRWPTDALGRTLWLWLTGGLCFVVLLNWTVNARSILLLAPPAVLLFARRSEGRPVLRRAALATTAALGVVVCAADADLAAFGRSEAARVERELGREHVRFAGHWGFQHYMEAAGYAHIDLAGDVVRPGDVVVAPVMHQVANGGLPDLAPRRREVHDRPRRLPVAVMDPEAGAGLHGSFLGPLPFAPSTGPLERVEVLRW